MSLATQEKLAAATEQRQGVALGVPRGHITMMLLPRQQACPHHCAHPHPKPESTAYPKNHPGRGLQSVQPGSCPRRQPHLTPLTPSLSGLSHTGLFSITQVYHNPSHHRAFAHASPSG